MSVWTVFAEWSAEDGVWFARASNMPGLHVDAATVDELAKRAAEHIASLLDINHDQLTSEDLKGPHTVRVVAHHEQAVPVAA